MSRPATIAWNELRPFPSRLWIRWTPADWPVPPTPATDLATGGLLGGSSSSGVLPECLPPAPEVIYLPPTRSELEPLRTELALRALDEGFAVVWQRLPRHGRAPEGAYDVVDLLPAVLSGIWPLASELEGASLALWPLLPAGPGELAAEAAAGLAELETAGVPALFGLALELSAFDRRRLADNAGERLFDRLFHGDPPEPRELARLGRSRGLAWGLARPSVRVDAGTARNREIAGLLAATADLWGLAGRSEGTGAEIWRAAREAEAFDRDLAILAREGRLGLLPWLGGPAREIVAAWAAGKPVALMRALEEEWLAVEEQR